MRVLYVLVISVLSLQVQAGPFQITYPKNLPCPKENKTCHFEMIIEERLTMMEYTDLLVPCNGSLYKSDYNKTTGINEAFSNSPVSDPDVVQADGYYQNTRLVIVANNQLPGPPLKVYDGQRVIVNVVSHLKSEGMTIHWHGLHMKNNSHNDGVSFISQCPIMPGQTFVYDFTVHQTGTHWYHAHIGAQRTQGLFGAFIIYPRDDQSDVEDEIMVVNDWNHDYDSNVGHLKMVYGLFRPNSGKYGGAKSPDGSLYSIFDMQTALVNGKGRYRSTTPRTDGCLGNRKHNGAPLQEYMIKENQVKRFRVISGGTLYPLRISIDSHMLTMLSSDGYEFDPITVESFIISPGERFDFQITANQTVDNYWIRLESVEQVKHYGEAVLHYEGADNKQPNQDYDEYVISTRSPCTADDKCVVLNCPFEDFGADTNLTCTHLQELKGKYGAPPANEDMEEVFLNFGFPGNGYTPGAINGKTWKYPEVSAFSQPKEMNEKNSCDYKDHGCGLDSVCKCTNIKTLQYNKVYQFVFTNLGINHMWAHPIHMHGHGYHIIKQGFAKFDPDTGLKTGPSADVTCLGTKNYCNEENWANSSLSHMNPENSRPIVKDTVMVPAGGYTVVRMKADNPGWWFSHCHIELHNLDGMAMVFNEAPELQGNVAANFPTCRSYISPSGLVYYGEAELTEPTVRRVGNLVTQPNSAQTAYISITTLIISMALIYQ